MSSLWARATRGTHAQRIRRIVLFLATLLLVFAAVGSFALVHHDAHVAAIKSAAGRVAVLATVVSAPGIVDPGVAPCATVTFCTPDGKKHQAEVAIGPQIQPGQHVPLWVTPSGALTTAPSGESPLRRSLTGWVEVSALTALALVGCVLVSARWAMRHDERQFERIVAPLRGDEKTWDSSVH